LPRTAADAAASHDPRKPISERYQSRDAYLAAARDAAARLVKERYLLEGDLEQVMRRMELQWSESVGESRTQ
jgi:hypothetical protein